MDTSNTGPLLKFSGPALDRDGATPLHTQIATHFRKQILGNFWPVGFKLKAEADLARELRVSRGTIRRAIKDLVDEHLLEQIQGKGTYVKNVKPMSLSSELSALSGPLFSNGEQLSANGIYFVDDLLERKIIEEDTANAIFPGANVLQFSRLRTLLEGPQALIETQISLTAFPKILSLSAEELTAEPFHGLLKRLYSVTFSHAERIYSAEPANERTAELLQVEIGSPLLVHEQYSFDTDGRCIERSRAWARSDRHKQTLTIKAIS